MRPPGGGPGGRGRCGKMAAAEAAAAAALRLSRQERELRWLAAEVGRLKEQEAPCSPERCSPELQRLRAENEKLRYRLLHLRRSLAAELGRAAPPETSAAGEVAPGEGLAPRSGSVQRTAAAWPGRVPAALCSEPGQASAGREGAGGAPGSGSRRRCGG